MAELLDSLQQRSTAEASQPSAAESLAGWIDAIGFGRYQVHIFILSAGFIVAEGAEIQMASGLSNAICDEFGIVSEFGRSMLMTSTFLGFAGGTLSSGPLGDFYGRRVPMLAGYVGVVGSALALYVIHNLASIYVLRLVLGFFSGIGIPAALITISEVSPRHLRGVCTAAVGLAYVFGDIWAAAGLWTYLPHLQSGNWRRLLLWAAIPASSLIAFGFVSPATRHDTPYFLAAQGQGLELGKVVRNIAAMNSQPHLGPASGEDLSSCIDLATLKEAGACPISASRALHLMCKYPQSLNTAILALLFFAKDFCYYGMGVFWPMAWSKLELEELPPAQGLFLTALLGLPGVALAMLAMYRMDRRPAIAIGGVICAITAFFIRELENEGVSAFGLLGVVFFKLCFPTLQMVTMLLPSEIFPTQIRNWAYGNVACIGRIATIVSPFVVESSHPLFLSVCGFLGVSGAVAAYWLPETKDCELVFAVGGDTQLEGDDPKLGYGTLAAMSKA